MTDTYENTIFVDYQIKVKTLKTKLNLLSEDSSVSVLNIVSKYSTLSFEL